MEEAGHPTIQIIFFKIFFYQFAGEFDPFWHPKRPNVLISYKVYPKQSPTIFFLFRVCFRLWCEFTSTRNVTEWQVSWNSWYICISGPPIQAVVQAKLFLFALGLVWVNTTEWVQSSVLLTGLRNPVKSQYLFIY